MGGCASGCPRGTFLTEAYSEELHEAADTTRRPMNPSANTMQSLIWRPRELLAPLEQAKKDILDAAHTPHTLGRIVDMALEEASRILVQELVSRESLRRMSERAVRDERTKCATLQARLRQWEKTQNETERLTSQRVEGVMAHPKDWGATLEELTRALRRETHRANTQHDRLREVEAELRVEREALRKAHAHQDFLLHEMAQLAVQLQATTQWEEARRGVAQVEEELTTLRLRVEQLEEQSRSLEDTRRLLLSQIEQERETHETILHETYERHATEKQELNDRLCSFEEMESRQKMAQEALQRERKEATEREEELQDRIHSLEELLRERSVHQDDESNDDEDASSKELHQRVEDLTYLYNKSMEMVRAGEKKLVEKTTALELLERTVDEMMEHLADVSGDVPLVPVETEGCVLQAKLTVALARIEDLSRLYAHAMEIVKKNERVLVQKTEALGIIERSVDDILISSPGEPGTRREENDR